MNSALTPILLNMNALAELTEARRKGSLGTSAIKWLEARGVIASSESETVLNSPKEQRARMWDDGTGLTRP
jgi:hypothetical protein